MQPPTLLSLTIDSALRHIAHIADLSAIPDPIVLELFWVTLLSFFAPSASISSLGFLDLAVHCSFLSLSLSLDGFHD
ncbi:hypothetical protein C4D60_Mb08t05700 [Musa balbisiana]|uniref:Uncharacterized protein n=1 Tax=Musa balbisiana TaxID=52838 RepID=A0A4S8K1K9_MUSBA|nr:hypothetical protein C4D60_Mb08t05700 [Musa balbisiana]